MRLANERKQQMKTNMKTLRAAAQTALDGKINTKSKLYAALPTLVAQQHALESARKTLNATGALTRKLSEACAAFAKDNETVFEAGRLIENQNGVRVGDIVIDDTAYHLACGYDGYMRTDGGKMTQDFLATLPTEWTTKKCELSTSGINANAPTEDDLAKYGLREKPNNTWSAA